MTESLGTTGGNRDDLCSDCGTCEYATDTPGFERPDDGAFLGSSAPVLCLKTYRSNVQPVRRVAAHPVGAPGLDRQRRAVATAGERLPRMFRPLAGTHHGMMGTMSGSGSSRGDISDETLMAFADGELPDAEMERIGMLVEEDEALAMRLQDFVESRDILLKTYGPIAKEPVPEHLVRFVMSGGAQGGKPAPRVAQPSSVGASASPVVDQSRWFQTPLAAALAGLVVGGLGVFMTIEGQRSDVGPSRFATMAAADAAIVQALRSTPDGRRAEWKDTVSGRSGEVRLQATHRVVGNTFCRRFEVLDKSASHAFAGIGCRRDDAWRIEVIASEAKLPNGAFQPASGAAKGLESFLDALDAEAVADTEVEQLIVRNWGAQR